MYVLLRSSTCTSSHELTVSAAFNGGARPGECTFIGPGVGKDFTRDIAMIAKILWSA
jgi:hypothetical protein